MFKRLFEVFDHLNKEFLENLKGQLDAKAQKAGFKKKQHSVLLLSEKKSLFVNLKRNIRNN